jgi:hypothetical protein
VVGAVAAVAKAISDDDNSSDSYSDDDEERREQEQEAKRQRKHDRLTAQLANIKKDRLELASELLANAAEVLGAPKKKIEFQEAPSSWMGLGSAALLAQQSLGQPVGQFFGQSLGQPGDGHYLHRLEAALESEVKATSALAQFMGSILDLADYSQGDFMSQERNEFLVDLQLLESFYGAISVDSKGMQDLTALRESRRRIDSLQRLKQQLEQQG